jgi:hypothetical protein
LVFRGQYHSLLYHSTGTNPGKGSPRATK